MMEEPCTMGTVIVDDPKFTGEKSVDGNGRVYLGEGYESKKVKIVIEEIVEDGEEKNS